MMWLMSPAKKSTADAAAFAPLLVKEGLGMVERNPMADTEHEESLIGVLTALPIAGKPAPTTASTISERAT